MRLLGGRNSVAGVATFCELRPQIRPTVRTRAARLSAGPRIIRWNQKHS
jgi:hypothetical protein